MRRYTQKDFRLIFGKDLREVAPNSEQLDKYKVVGEYTPEELGQLLFLTTDAESLSVYTPYESQCRFFVYSDPGAKIYTLRNNPNKFSDTTVGKVGLKCPLHLFGDNLYRYITIGSKQREKYTIQWMVDPSGVVYYTFPAKYTRPQMFLPTDLQNMLLRGIVLLPDSRNEWCYHTVHRLPDSFEYPEAFSGLSCPIADAPKLVSKLYSEGVLVRFAGVNATHFFAISIKKYTESRHPTETYGKYLSRSIHSELTCDLRGSTVPDYKLEHTQVADVLEGDFLFDTDGYLYPTKSFLGEPPDFNVLTVKDVVFPDGSVLTCDKEHSEYAVFTNSSERYIPWNIRIRHLANKGFIAVKRSDLDKCNENKTGIAESIQKQYNLGDMDSEKRILMRYLDAGRKDLLLQDLTLRNQVEAGSHTVLATISEKVAIDELYHTFFTFIHEKPLLNPLKLFSGMSNKDEKIVELLQHIFGDKPYAKYSAIGELVVPRVEIYNIENYLPHYAELAKVLPGVNSLIRGILEHTRELKQNLILTI